METERVYAILDTLKSGLEIKKEGLKAVERDGYSQTAHVIKIMLKAEIKEIERQIEYFGNT